MKFIKLVAFLGLSFSDHAIAAIPEPWEDEVELDQRPRLRGVETKFIERPRFGVGVPKAKGPGNRGPSASGSTHGPIIISPGCNMPSQSQLIGNQCIGRTGSRTACCVGSGPSWVQCSKVCLTYDYDVAEDYDSEDYDSEDYDYDEVADAFEEE